MSCYFQVDGRDVWNPANAVARVFIAQADGFSLLVEEDHGIGEIVDDESVIDIQKFSSFVGALAAQYEQTNNVILRSLSRGFISVALVLVRRGGGELPPSSAEYKAMWETEIRNNDASMPHG